MVNSEGRVLEAGVRFAHLALSPTRDSCSPLVARVGGLRGCTTPLLLSLEFWSTKLTKESCKPHLNNNPFGRVCTQGYPLNSLRDSLPCGKSKCFWENPSNLMDCTHDHWSVLHSRRTLQIHVCGASLRHLMAENCPKMGTFSLTEPAFRVPVIVKNLYTSWVQMPVHAQR